MKKNEIDILDTIRISKIEHILCEEDIDPLPFVSLDETTLVEDTHVDEEVNYNEVDLDTFL